MAHCCRKVDEKLPFRRAESAPMASLRRITTASDKSTAREAASRARTQPRVSRRTWKAMSGESGSELTMTLPSLLSHQRTTAAPQPRGEASQEMTATWAYVASLASQEGSVERAGNEGPEGASHDRVVLEHAADKQRRLPDDGWERDDRVVVCVAFSAED
jgi:hypothetical protein